MKHKITSTKNKVNLLDLSPTEFEEFCFWILDDMKKKGEIQARSIEFYGGSGDKGRDIVVCSANGEEMYYNCKRYQKNTFPVFKEEIEKLAKYRDENNKTVLELIFCTAVDASPFAMDKTKEYGIKNGFNYISFWGRVKLDIELKTRDTVKKNFYSSEDEITKTNFSKEDTDNMSNAIAEKLVEKFSETENRISNPAIFKQNFQLLGLDSISGELISVKEEIDAGEYKDTEQQLYKYIGQLELDIDNRREELFKANNLLGIIYLRRNEAQNKDDLEKAVDYFSKAIGFNPDSFKGYNNLYLAYLALGRESEIDEKVLDRFKDEPFIIHLKTIKTSIEKDADSARKYLDEQFEVNPELKDNDSLNLLYAQLLLEKGMYDECIEHCEKIKTNRKADVYYFIGSSYFMKAVRDDKIGEEQFTAIFKDTENILNAINFFEKGLKVVKKTEERTREGLELNLFQARSFIGEQKIDLPEIKDKENPDYHSVKAFHLFKERKFNEAYEEFNKVKKIEESEPESAIKLAEKFIYEGQVEIAEEILTKVGIKKIDNGFQKRKYLLLSNIGTLNNNKNSALINAKKAKELAGDNTLDLAYFNFSGVSLRFGEVDRAFKNIFDIHKKHPEEKLVEGFDIDLEEDKNKLIDFFKRHKERMDSIVKIFSEQPFPYYLLAKKEILNRKFIEFWSGNNGVIPIKFNVGNKERTEKEKALIENRDSVVLDYISLLTLSEFDGGFKLILDNFKNVYVSKTLFWLIQWELTYVENENLRRVWEFLRSNKKIELKRETIKSEFRQKELLNYFDDWVKETIAIANKEDALLLSDDLRFGNFLTNEGIVFTNTSTLLQLASERGDIDRSIYAEGLAKIAEKGYEFVQFKADDIYELELKYSERIHPGLEKLFSQISLSEAEIGSFVSVAVGFIKKIKKWQIPNEKKIEYLKFFAKMFEKSYYRFYQVKNLNELAKIIFNFWAFCKKNLKIDNDSWMQAVEDVFNVEYLSKYKEILLKLK